MKDNVKPVLAHYSDIHKLVADRYNHRLGHAYEAKGAYWVFQGLDKRYLYLEIP